MAHWPQEKVDQLVHMVTDKINVKSIATQLSVTPTVISSKIARLRRAGVLPPTGREVKIREKLPKPPKEPKPKKLRQKETPQSEPDSVASGSPDPKTVLVPPRKPSKRKKVAILPPEEEEDDLPPKVRPLRPLELLGSRDCRWPLGDPRSPEFKFCGKRIEPNQSGPYCREHHHIAFQQYSRGVMPSAAD